MKKKRTQSTSKKQYELQSGMEHSLPSSLFFIGCKMESSGYLDDPYGLKKKKRKDLDLEENEEKEEKM
jgi:hypothetical protein